ncbi:MAG TPA: hypothetical protein VIF61_00480 [Methylocystis sp.]|jgi:hypothetical protein
MRFKIVLQALTPISHGDTVTGVDNSTNTRLFMRQQMLVDGKPGRVPSISENALRGVVFRETLADDLVSRLGIERGSLPQAVVNLLYSGGAMAAGSRAPGDEITLGHAVKRLYPSLDLIGGAVDGFILPRSRLKICAWIVASEYAQAIERVAPELVEEARAVSAYDLLADETRVRGTGAESAGNQMLYGYETLAAGAKILVELTTDHHTPDVTLSAIGHALSIWDGFFGGQSRQGRGRMATLTNGAPTGDLYVAHVEARRDEMRAGLISGTLGTAKTLCAA